MAAASSSAPTTRTRYDEVAYPTSSYPQSHPNRLAAMAALLGMAPASPSKSRVLELGCADGANILPMAEQAPEATFLGIDGSMAQIAAGQAAQAAAGLKNVELRCQDLLTFPSDAGLFDYIIVHGVFSWVGDAVREKILEICATHLAPKGIAYVSYNALPGWNMRRSLRDVMRYHTGALTDPKAKIQQARAVLTFLSDSVPVDNNPYGLLLRQELQFLSGQDDRHLLHEYLLEDNTPFYFHEFVGRAAGHGLQYLSETNLAQMLASNFPEKVRQTLNQLGNQLIAQEQYMDFLRNRAFRETLLCRADVAINRNIVPHVLRDLAIQPLFRRSTASIDLTPGVKVEFVTLSGAQLTTDDAFVKSVFHRLAEVGAAGSISYRELLEAGRARTRPVLGAITPDRDAIDEATLDNNLMNLLARGLIEVLAHPVGTRSEIPPQPIIAPLARYQAVHARHVTNRLHQPAPADVVARMIMEVCDGSRSHEEIVEILLLRIKEGKLQIAAGTNAITDETQLRALLQTRVRVVLASLADGGFFAL